MEQQTIGYTTLDTATGWATESEFMCFVDSYFLGRVSTGEGRWYLYEMGHK
jgi:hypothetical protein